MMIKKMILFLAVALYTSFTLTSSEEQDVFIQEEVAPLTINEQIQALQGNISEYQYQLARALAVRNVLLARNDESQETQNQLVQVETYLAALRDAIRKAQESLAELQPVQVNENLIDEVDIG